MPYSNKRRYLHFVLLITPLSYIPLSGSTTLSDVLARLLASPTDGPSELVSLARVLERTENCRTLRVFLDIFNDVDQVGYLREERIIVREAMCLLEVRARAPDMQHWLHVRVDELELVAIGVYLELTRIVVALERDNVAEAADRAVLVFPRRGRDTRDAVLRGNLGFVYRLLVEETRVLVPLEGVGGDR